MSVAQTTSKAVASATEAAAAATRHPLRQKRRTLFHWPQGHGENIWVFTHRRSEQVIYSFQDLERHGLGTLAAFNPLTGIMGLYRAAFFPHARSWFTVAVSAVISVVVLVIGILVFRGSIRTVLKEI